MEQFPYNSPPQTPVKRMINPEPFDTTPLQRLPELLQWLQDKSSTPTRQGFISDPRPRPTNWMTSRAFPSRPQQGRVNPETSLRQTLEFGSRSRSSDARSAAPPPSQLHFGTPTAEVVDKETDRSGSPVPSPRLRRTEWASTPTAPLRDQAPLSPPAVAGGKTVHFRNTPIIYEVERTGWRPVSEHRRRRQNNRRFRVVEVDRPPIFPESAKKLAFDLLPWAFCIAFVVAFVGIVAQLKGSSPIVQHDMRTRIPPEFYFTHREFRNLTPEKAPAYEYLSKAGKAGMRHLDQLIRLNKEAARQEKVDGPKKKEWHCLSRQLDWVKIEWDGVLRNVRGEEKELITQSTNWYDTKAAAQSSLHSPQMAALAANERLKAREGWLEDIRGAAGFAAKAIENQSRFVNSSLDTAKRVADMMLPSGCGQWVNILLGPDFEEEKPGYLNRLPSVYTKLAPSWTSKWLERKRSRMQICSTLVTHLAHFQDYVRIVILSNEHLRAAARGVTELTGVDDSPASLDDMIPPSIIVTSDDLNRPINFSASFVVGAAETARTPYRAEGAGGNQTSTTPILPDHTLWSSGYRAVVKRWGRQFVILKNKVSEWGQFLSPTARLTQLSRWFTAAPGDNEAALHVPKANSPYLSPVHSAEEEASEEALGDSQRTTPEVAGTSPSAFTEPKTEGDAPVEQETANTRVEDEAPAVDDANLTGSPESSREGVAAEAEAKHGSPSPHPPVPACEPGSTLPCNLPGSTVGVAAPDEESIPPSTSSIVNIPSQRNSHLVHAARKAGEKRDKSALTAAPVTIDDIFRAWDKIVGGISLVIEREFRT